MRSGGNATATVFRGCFLGVYASLKSRNVSAKPRSCCQILPDHVHVMSDFGSSTLTATLLLREAQGEVSKHYSSSRTKCGATQTSKHIQLQSQLPQCCRCDQEAQVKCIFLCQIFTNYLRWNCSMKWFFQREGLIFALVLLRVSKLACSVKFHQCYVSLSLRAQVAINGLHPRRTALSGGLHVSPLTAVVAGEDFVNDGWDFASFQHGGACTILYQKNSMCLCLTHAYLGSSGGKGGSMMAFVEDKFIVKAS